MLKLQSKAKTSVLKVPYYEQSIYSSSCGIYSLKMILDFLYQQKKITKTYSIKKLMKYCGYCKKMGVDEDAILSYLEQEHIFYTFVDFRSISSTLKHSPLLCLFKDEVHDGHYAALIGIQERYMLEDQLIFHDPWPEYGAFAQRRIDKFYNQLAEFDFWILKILGNSQF